MARVKTIAAGIFLGAGLFISVLTGTTIVDRKTDPQTHTQAAVGLFVLGICPIAIGSWLVLKNQQQDGQQEQERLQSVFYKLLKQNNGQINVLRFSMEANINGAQAKAFLDDRAREFNARFDVSEEGKISYYFDGDFQALPQAQAFDVILESFQWRHREHLVSVIQHQMNVERRTAKAMLKQAHSYPVTIARGVSETRANSLRKSLEALQAKVLIIPKEQ